MCMRYKPKNVTEAVSHKTKALKLETKAYLAEARPGCFYRQRVLNAAARVITGTRKFDRGLGQILHDQLH